MLSCSQSASAPARLPEEGEEAQGVRQLRRQQVKVEGERYQGVHLIRRQQVKGEGDKGVHHLLRQQVKGEGAKGVHHLLRQQVKGEREKLSAVRCQRGRQIIVGELLFLWLNCWTHYIDIRQASISLV